MHYFSGDDQLNSILSNTNHSVFSQGRQSFCMALCIREYWFVPFEKSQVRSSNNAWKKIRSKTEQYPRR